MNPASSFVISLYYIHLIYSDLVHLAIIFLIQSHDPFTRFLY